MVKSCEIPSESSTNQLRQVSIQCREQQGPRLGGAKGDLVAGAQAAGGDPGDEWRLLLEKKMAKNEEPK